MKKCTHGERARAQRVREGCRTLKDLVSLSLFAVELTIVAGVCAAAIRHGGKATLLRRGRNSPAGGKLLVRCLEMLIKLQRQIFRHKSIPFIPGERYRQGDT